jgi:hypothetical protein
MVPLFALLLVAGCSNEPTDDLRNGTARLDAAPSQLFIELGATKAVDVSAVDDQGNQISSAYEVTNTGSGITVERDTTFLPIFVNDSTLRSPDEAPVFRYNVTGTAYAATSFTVSNGVKDVVIPVQVIPQAGIAATFSSTTPALGDTVTLTAPAGTTFAPTSTVTVTGATLQPLIVSQSETEIRFIPPPNINSPLTISDVTSVSAPGLTFAPQTTEILSTPVFDSLDVTFDNTTPNVGQTVTVTLPSPLMKFQPTSTITFPDELADPANLIVSADSSTLTFEAPPNATGPGRIDSIIFPGNFALSLPTRPTITAENIGTTLAATFNTQTPAAGQSVTVTAPAGFSFDPAAATANIGGIAPIVTGTTATTITFLPPPGLIGPVDLTGIVLGSAPQFSLALQTTDTLTIGSTITPLAGTDAPGTAPSIAVPAIGETTALIDGGTYDYPAPIFGGAFGLFPSRLYKLVVPSGRDITVTITWGSGDDLGGYWFAADGTTEPPTLNAADAGGGGASPESSTSTFAAGTYLLAIVNFGPGDPPFFSIQLDGE